VYLAKLGATQIRSRQRGPQQAGPLPAVATELAALQQAAIEVGVAEVVARKMGLAEVALDGDLVGEAGVGEIDAHGLTVAHLQPQALAAAEICQSQIAAQKARLPQVATLQLAAQLALPLIEGAVNESALTQVQPGEVAVDKAATIKLFLFHILLFETLPLEALAL